MEDFGGNLWDTTFYCYFFFDENGKTTGVKMKFIDDTSDCN